MQPVADLLNFHKHLKLLQHLLPDGEPCYLVGGAIRDWLLGIASSDFDFATPADPTPLAKAFAAKTTGRWFWLDRPRCQSRVVVKTPGGILGFDFAPFRAEDLDADLRLRDFTVNAIAFSLQASGGGEALIDPLGGLGDLEKSILRICSPGVIDDDPLRILRGVRQAAAFGLTPERQTQKAMRSAMPALSRVAAERIRRELSLIFDETPVAPGLRLMDDIGLLKALFGQETGEAVLQQAVRLEEVLGRLSQHPEFCFGAIDAYADDGFSGKALLILTAILSFDASGGLVTLPAKTWQMSRKNSAVIDSLLRLHRRKGIPALPEKAGARGRALWAEALGPCPQLALIFLVALGDGVVPDIDTARQVIRDYLSLSSDGRIPDLVDGRWFSEGLGLPPGPLVGKLLKQLRIEEIEGRVLSVSDAHKFLKLQVDKNR